MFNSFLLINSWLLQVPGSQFPLQRFGNMAGIFQVMAFGVCALDTSDIEILLSWLSLLRLPVCHCRDDLLQGCSTSIFRCFVGSYLKSLWQSQRASFFSAMLLD
ncbi:hypothetical protein Dsin_002066 [Dipteronia sinensis]|uniref:Uncharacterized protein n=1 Tax=Dipteronia sinensis TaxID=43782 RepID=A0AAE0EKW6_9ROSI|nr:hypothetical protein Dsin_002066 [Dipteronia sinensis]